MTSTSYDYPIHPLADVFPNLPAEEFKKLKLDIKEHGQLEPIMLDRDGKVLLDGRHRLRACKELGITPKLDRLEQKSEADFIWSKNILRRHLTDDQRAAIGNQWYDAEKAAAKERQKHHGGTAPGKSKDTSGESTQSVRTRKAIAVKAQVSEHKVRQVEAVTKQAPELLPKVKSGEMKLKDAAKKVRVRRKTESVADRVAANPDQVIDVPVEKKEPQPETTRETDQRETINNESDDATYLVKFKTKIHQQLSQVVRIGLANGIRSVEMVEMLRSMADKLDFAQVQTPVFPDAPIGEKSNGKEN